MTSEQSRFYQAVAEKRRIMRAEYGGMMTKRDLAKELGFGSIHSVDAWLEREQIPGTRLLGRAITYETDVVAKRLVERRGMA